MKLKPPAYQIFVRHLHPNIQERVPIPPRRLVIHSTANPGATSAGHFKWLDSARRHGWANYYLDWDEISQLVPEGMMAPAQGPTANKDSLSIELCEPSLSLPQAEQERQFAEVWKRGVWLASDILFRYGWPVGAMQGHFQISQLYPRETDHTDPVAFFTRYNATWQHFVDAVQTAVDVLRAEYPTAEDWQYDAVRQLQEGGLLHDLRHPRKTVEWWELAFMLGRIRAAAVEEAMTKIRSV